VRIPSGDARVSTADEEKILRKAQQIARRRLEHEAQMTERKRLEKLERQAAEARADDDRGEDESRTRVPMNPERARHMAVEGKWGLASLWASNFKKKNNIPEPGPADVPLHEPAAAAGSGGEAPGRNSRLSQASGRASRLSDQSQLSSRPLPVKPLKTHALKQELPGRPPVEPTPREKRLRKQAELLHKVESLGQPEPSASASGESRRKVKKLGCVRVCGGCRIICSSILRNTPKAASWRCRVSGVCGACFGRVRGVFRACAGPRRVLPLQPPH